MFDHTSEQLRLLASLALQREIGTDEELSVVNAELQFKLKRELIIKEQGVQISDSHHG